MTEDFYDVAKLKSVATEDFCDVRQKYDVATENPGVVTSSRDVVTSWPRFVTVPFSETLARISFLASRFSVRLPAVPV